MTDPNRWIFKAEVSGEDVQKVLERIEPLVVDIPKTHVMLACLGLAFMLQDPDMSVEELHDGVLGASQWICLYLHRLEENKLVPGTVDKNEIN